MTVLQSGLVEAYKATSYTLQIDDDIITFRIGFHSPATRAWLAKMAISEAGFITAYNPLGVTRTEVANELQHNDLLELVISKDLQYWEGQGVGADRLLNGEPEWPAERSLLISPLSRESVTQIGNRFAQNAVVHITADVAELVLLR